MDTRISIMAVALLSAAACAGGSQVGDGRTASTQQDTARQWTEYRTQASSLREMADRRQLEADLLAREVGPDDPAVEKKRRLADELRAAAVDADAKARQLGGQVPHGMVQ